MSDRTLVVLTLGVSLAGLYVSYRTAMALQDASNQINRVAQSPIGQVGSEFGKVFGW